MILNNLKHRQVDSIYERFLLTVTHSTYRHYYKHECKAVQIYKHITHMYILSYAYFVKERERERNYV